jgi:hypothetical protein
MWYEANVLMKKAVKFNLMELLKAVMTKIMARSQA